MTPTTDTVDLEQQNKCRLKALISILQMFHFLCMSQNNQKVFSDFINLILSIIGRIVKKRITQNDINRFLVVGKLKKDDVKFDHRRNLVCQHFSKNEQSMIQVLRDNPPEQSEADSDFEVVLTTPFLLGFEFFSESDTLEMVIDGATQYGLQPCPFGIITSTALLMMEMPLDTSFVTIMTPSVLCDGIPRQFILEEKGSRVDPKVISRAERLVNPVEYLVFCRPITKSPPEK